MPSFKRFLKNHIASAYVRIPVSYENATALKGMFELLPLEEELISLFSPRLERRMAHDEVCHMALCRYTV